MSQKGSQICGRSEEYAWMIVAFLDEILRRFLSDSRMKLYWLLLVGNL